MKGYSDSGSSSNPSPSSSPFPALSCTSSSQGTLVVVVVAEEVASTAAAVVTMIVIKIMAKIEVKIFFHLFTHCLSLSASLFRLFSPREILRHDYRLQRHIWVHLPLFWRRPYLLQLPRWYTLSLSLCLSLSVCLCLSPHTLSLGPRETSVGTEVEYSVRSGQKGPAAYNVREIDQSKVKLAPPPSSSSAAPSASDTPPVVARHRGLVSWDIDPYKNTPGILTLLTTQPQLPTSIVFTTADITKLPSNRRIAKGDEVEFDLHYMPGTLYAHARELSLFRTKKSRQVAEQIEMFTKAGVLLEHGVIDSIKGDFGFIKSCDRADQLFFRLDDLVDDTTRPNEVHPASLSLSLPLTPCLCLCVE
jgi:hypothetical protein